MTYYNRVTYIAFNVPEICTNGSIIGVSHPGGKNNNTNSCLPMNADSKPNYSCSYFLTYCPWSWQLKNKSSTHRLQLVTCTIEFKTHSAECACIIVLINVAAQMVRIFFPNNLYWLNWYLKYLLFINAPVINKKNKLLLLLLSHSAVFWRHKKL